MCGDCSTNQRPEHSRNSSEHNQKLIRSGEYRNEMYPPRSISLERFVQKCAETKKSVTGGQADEQAHSYSPLVNSSGRGQKCGTHTYYPILVTNWQICVYKCVYTELDANILISLVGQENYLKYAIKILMCIFQLNTVETLYSTIYYSQNFIELNIDKSTQYVALWTHKRHPIPRPFGRAMECLLWVLQQKLIVL